VPKLSDKLIGTSVGGEIEDITYNFTLLELLELYLPIIPANNLQGVLDYGNTATQDINLFGTITTTNLDVTDTANLFITYLNEETHLVGSLFDSADSVGTAGQVLTSTGDGVEWFTLPPIFTPNLEQVLTEGNTSDIDILLDANLEALDVSSDTATVGVNLNLGGTITDNNAAVGSAGQVLSSTVTGVAWVSLPVYSATSPLLFNSATGVFSIQVANSTQGGYLTANDWVTFDGKQNAGAYITALTGEATATGPGSVPITLNNASVTAKVLTGLNVTGGSISASDSILTAFGKVQSQINGLMGGVQYQGVWDAATNTPTLTSSVGTQGHYYIVNVAGSTDLNGITDWKVGDWAIFSGGTWQKVDNTESVTSVNGQTGAVSLTTDNIPEGATNLYYLDSRARAALSFAAGSGAYNSLTGVITIPTNNNQILNGANYITLSSISATSPLAYNNLTGVFSIQQADATHDGYLSSTDWSTFNGKQNYLGGTGLVKSTAGTITYITDNSGNWNTAYNRSIVSAAVTGTTTKTLTLNEQDGNTITASWTDLDTGLTSVGVSMPSAFSVANSPLTSNGTIAVTGAGTTLEYIDGTGALRTFPGLTGYVPYTGATTNVDLGEFGISAGYFQADLTPTGALQVGRMQWNATDGTMDLRLMGNNVTLQIGQENVTRVVNKSGIDLLEANYQVVRVRKVAEGGAQGQRLAVVLAQGNNENNSTEVIGLVTETILVNEEGFVTAFGEVKNINTTGSLQGETWVDGDILYVSTSVAGQLTNVRPVAPNHAVTVGYVTYAHANNGKIYMAIDTGYELGELHNVYAPSPAANASIWWNTGTLRYENNTIAGILGYTPANPALYVPYTGATSDVNLGAYGLTLGNNLFINGNNSTQGGYLGFKQFATTQVGLSGYTSFSALNSNILYLSYNTGVGTSKYVQFDNTNITNNSGITLSFPNASGTLALTSDLTGGTVTSVAALTLGTSGTDLSSTVANPTTTPVITLNVPTASAANRGALSAADWSTFNTKVGGVTATSPLFSSGGQTPNITIQQSSGSQDGYLSSTDWTTFNSKQAAGNYITSLTGEATGTGPGATAVTLNNASVTAKVLTGINITGGTVQATDTMLTAFGKLQNQINGLIGSTIYQGTWNASTNTPALASGVGTRGWYYIVNVAGNTNLDGITDWFVGDWAIFDGTAWQQVDNTDAVVSVNGQTGAVSLTTDNIPEGSTNQYFLNSRARAALSFVAGSGAYNSTTGVITIPTNNNQITNGANYITLASLSGTAPIVYSNTTGAISITQSGTASDGYLSSTDWNTFNNKAPSVSGGYLPLSGGTMTGVITSSVTQPFIFTGNSNTGTYTRSSMYVAQNNTSGNTANGIFFERGRITDDINGEVRYFVIGARGSTIQWMVDGTGYTTQYNSAEVKPSADGNYFIGRSSSSSNTPFRAYQSAGDGYIDLATAAGAVITRLSGYTGTASYTLGKFGIGKSSSITYTLDVDGGGTNTAAAQFVKQAYGVGSDGVIARFVNNVSTGYSSYIFIGSNPGTDWSIGKNISNPTVAAPNFEIVDSSNILTFKIAPGGAITLPTLAGTGTRMVVTDANGLISTQAIPTGTVTGTGTSGYIPKWTSASAIGNSAIQDDGTNIIITSRNTTTTNYLGSTLGSGGIYFSGDTTPDIGYIGYNYTNVGGTETVYQSSRASWRQHFGNGSTTQWKVAYRAGAAAAGAFTDYLTISSAGAASFVSSVTATLFAASESNSASPTQIQINNTSSASTTTKTAQLLFRLADTVGTVKSAAYIRAVPDGVNVLGAGLSFATRAGDADPVERIFVTAGLTTLSYSGGSNTLVVSGTGTPYKSILDLQYNATVYGATLTYDASPESLTIENYGRSASGTTQGDINFRTKVNNTTPTNVLNLDGYTGAATFSSLAGTGSRMVIADANGLLSTQSIPTGTVTGSGTATYLPIWSSSTGLGDSKISQPDANNVLVNFADTYSQGGKFTLVSTFVSKLLIGRTNLGAGAAGSNVDLIYDIAGAEIFEIRRNYSAATFKLTLNNGTSVVDHLTISSAGVATFTNSLIGTTATFTNSSGETLILSKPSGPSIQFNKTLATAQGWQLSGEETAFKLYNTTATTTPFQVSTSGITTFTVTTNKTVATYNAPSTWSGISDYVTGGVGIAFSRPNDGALANAIFTFNGAGDNNFAISARSSFIVAVGGGLGGSTQALKIIDSGAATFASSITATAIIKTGGTSSQYLMADGSVTTGGGGAYLPLAGGTMTGQITSYATAPLSFQGNGNTGTYTQTTIYGNQNNTSGDINNGIFIERGYTDTSNTEIRYFVIGARGGSVQWKMAGTGYTTQYDAAEVKSRGDGYEMFVGRFSSGSAKLFRAYQAAGDGYLELRTGADNIVTKLSGYTGTIGYTLAPFVVGQTTQINSAPFTAYGANLAASFGTNQSGAGSGLCAYFVNSSGGGYSSWIYIGSAPGTDWKIGKNISNPTSAVYNFEIVDSSNNLRMQINNGTGNVTFSNDVIAYSDARLKKNIRNIENPLDKIMKTRGVLYDRIDTAEVNTFGFIAQELEEIFPELVTTNQNGIKGVKYQNAVAVLFEALKEQQKQIDELKKQVA